MIRPARSLTIAAALSTALALTACGDDSDEAPATDSAPVFTEQETTEAQDDESSASASASAAEDADPSASASEDADDDEPEVDDDADERDDDDEASSSASSDDVEVSVTAPDNSSWSNNPIIKTGQTSYEMTSDYTRYEQNTKLPSVGWSTAEDLQDCSTKVTYTSADGTELAQYRTQDCESSISEGELSDSYEWFDRGPLPTQGQEVDLTIVVEIESGDDTQKGESTITLRNPNNYR